jgi:DNA polymerase III subunit delta
MKVSAAEADRVTKNPPKGAVAALLFGPDAGLVRERSDVWLKTAVEDLTDPFRFVDFDEAALNGNPARLADEAAQMSMLGGRRAVRVRGCGNSSAKIFQTFLIDPKGDALIAVEAGDLAKSSALRKVFEEAKNAVAIACYGDSQRDLPEVVRGQLKAEGLAIASDALSDAVSRLGSDRGVTRRELEKLALYAKGQSQVTLDDVRAVMGDEAEARSEEAVDAMGAGDFPRLDLALARLKAADVSPVAVVRQAMGHLQRILLVKARIEEGDSLDEAMRPLRPPVHFSRASSFRTQVQHWHPERLFAALDLLFEAETSCKTTAVPAMAALGQTMIEIAVMAKRSR